MAAMLPPSAKETGAAPSDNPRLELQRQGYKNVRRQSRRRSPSPSDSPHTERNNLLAEETAGTAAAHTRRRKKTRKKRKRAVSQLRRRRGGGGGSQLVWGDRDGGGGSGGAGVGWSLSEEERIGIVTDLVELFQQVDHNGDQVGCE